MPMPRTFLALLLILPISALAGLINKHGESLPDRADRKAIGDFGAQMVFVPDEQSLFKVWDTPAATVDVPTVDKVSPGDQLNAFIVFGGCKTDKVGHCDVTVRFRVLQPNGKVFVHTPPMEVWQFKKAPAGRTLELGAQYLKVALEPADMTGRYTVVADIKDHVSGASLNLSAPFTAVRSK
jgi:hypothetical protein